MASLHLMMIACLVIVAAAVPTNHVRTTSDDQWEAWKAKHGRSYKTVAEHAARYEQYKTTRNVVNQHNAEHDAGKHTHKLALNQFADWTVEEKKARLMGSNPPKTEKSVRRTVGEKRATHPTTYHDWTTSGLIPPVGNQGCGNCYAFSTTYLISYYYAVSQKLKSPFLLSAEQATCGTYAPSTGCWGGWPSDVITYVYKNGLDPASSYPFSNSYYNYYMFYAYHQTKNQTLKQACPTPNAATVVKPWTTSVSGYNGNAVGEDAMATYIGTTGPGVVAVDAMCDQFINYDSGVISTSACTVNGQPSTIGIDHAVMAVGYLFDSKTNLPYYRIQNSWGTGWGLSGFTNILAFDNMCGIGQNGLFYPVGISGSAPPPTQPPTTAPATTTAAVASWCTAYDGTTEFGYYLYDCSYSTASGCTCNGYYYG